MSYLRRTALVVALAAASCSSTRLVTKWQSPTAEPLQFTKIVALALAPDESLRRIAEEDLCDEVKAVPCKPAYLAIPESLMGDVERMREVVTRAGYDGALVFRLVSAQEKVTYVPPSYGPTFWGYYRYAYPMAYQPGYTRTDVAVRVETSIYSLSQDQLLWVATTETMNPDSVDSLVDEVAETVRRELERAKLIPER
jgi:hypothetical protein